MRPRGGQDAEARHRLNGDILRGYLDEGQRERQRLAQALRNAANAYDQMDQNEPSRISCTL